MYVKSSQERLDVLLTLAKSLFKSKGHRDLLRYILSQAVNLVGADRGTIFLIDEDAEEINSYYAIGLDDREISLNIGKGIVGDVIHNRKIVNIIDAYKDKRFYSGVDQKTGYVTETVICVPIQRSDGNIIGAIELLNKNEGRFDSSDESLLLILSLFAAISIENNSKILHLKTENERLRQRLDADGLPQERFQGFLGQSDSIVAVQKLISQVARYRSNVIILGESGTGKEAVAHLVHDLSDTSEAPFIALNCAAIPEQLLEAELFGIEGGVATGVKQRRGKIEMASGGTLFLDEIGDMPMLTQAKLLRAIQEQTVERVGGKDEIKVDVRFVSATNKDLKKGIEDGTFREDLYYRINVAEIKLPPLRERKSDIPFLANHFIQKHNEKAIAAGLPSKSFSAASLGALGRYDWPGNVRQLENEIEKASIVSGDEETIQPSQLSVEITGGHGHGSAPIERTKAPVQTALGPDVMTLAVAGKTLHEIIDEVETVVVSDMLKATNGNKSKAAETLGISREGLRKMLVRLGIDSRKKESQAS